jgi:hypothetical protein
MTPEQQARQQQDLAVATTLQGLIEQIGLQDSRLQTLEREASAAPARDTEILNLILRMDSIISASLEEKLGYMNKITELQSIGEAQRQKIESLSRLVGQAEAVIQQQQEDLQQQQKEVPVPTIQQQQKTGGNKDKKRE